MPIKNEFFDFSDMSGGKNNAFPKHAIDRNQVADSLNVVHEKIGVSRAPGYNGFNSSELFNSPIRGFFVYVLDDGTEKLIAVSGLKIYFIDTENKTKTEIGTITSDGECYAVNAAGKLWIVNGTDFVKIESNLAIYRVQIIAPGASSAAIASGGTLPIGIYSVYAAYARVNGSGQYLYSLPVFCGTVTSAGGNRKVVVTIPNSTDPQVNKKVVFMTDAGGTVHYYYGEAANSSATVEILSDSNRNDDVQMNVVSASNQILPITPSAIYTFDDKLYVWDINDRTVYWSLKTDVNPFDMERFLAQNFRVMSYTVNSMFSVNEDLFFNHIGNGISKAISGDMSSVIKRVQKSFWYLDCITQDGKSNVVFHKGIAFGLTNDGFRFFDGNTFSEDLSFHIKPDVDAIYSGISGMLPCAIVNRRASKRTEYRFSYRNLDYGISSNNDQRIFNIDYYFDPVQSIKTWECWENGFNRMVVFGRSWYGAQSYTKCQLVYEKGTVDFNCYSRDGVFQTTSFLKQFYILTKTIFDDLDGITVWGNPYALATCAESIVGNMITFGEYNKFPFNILGVLPTVAVLPADGMGGLALPFAMNPQYPIGGVDPIPFECRSNGIGIELSQVASDDNLFLYKIQLPRSKQIKHNAT